jgi:hypothetical protein
MKNAVKMNAVERRGEVPVPICIPDLSHLLDPNYKDIGDPSMDELIETLKFYNDSCKDDEPDQTTTKNQSRNRVAKKRHRIRASQSRTISTAARDATLSMKCGTVATDRGICKKDYFLLFTQHFFNVNGLPEYSRLPAHLKLLLAQYIIHQTPGAEPTPFTHRYNLEQRTLSDQEMNKKIQRKLTRSLGRPVLLWSTSEHDKGRDKTLTHRHGEILLYPNELPVCRDAFREMFGLTENTADGTITTKLGLSHCIRFSLSKRQQQAAEYGWFYSIYNWPGYCTKDFQERQRLRGINIMLKQPLLADNTRFYYVSRDLGKLAAEFYTGRIRK